MTSSELVLPGQRGTLPRMLPGAVPSARAWTVVDEHLRALGSTFTVSRTRAAEQPPGPVTINPNIDYLIGWNTSSDLTVPMYSTVYPANVTILAPGTYWLHLQARFAAVGPTGLSGSNVGLRRAWIMLNGTSAPTDTVVDASPRAGSSTGDGATVVAAGMASLRAGDQVYAGFRHSASGVITTMNTDAGGTYLSVTYLGPGGNH